MSDLSAFPTQLPESPHYLRAVTELAHQRAVVAHEAIYAETGIKLVEKGMRIDSRLYDRLVQHTLSEPVDSHLVAEDAVDHTVITAVARELIAGNTLLQLLSKSMGAGFQQFWPILAQIPLPGPIMFKLTVMRQEREHLFLHSVEMAVVAWFLGVRNGLDDADCIALVAAALLHDLGVLHLDPDWHDRNHRITSVQRRQLVAHPIISMLMVRATEAYPEAVALALLEHHERMDGSGYPRNLAGAKISALGRILLLAEVVSTFYDKYADDAPGLHLATVLRLNHRKFPTDLCKLILPLLPLQLPEGWSAEATAILEQDAQRYLQAIPQAFSRWEQLSGVVAIEPDTPFAFVDNHLQALIKNLSEAGIHPDAVPTLLNMLKSDPQTTAELSFLGCEAAWQLETIANACMRRWPHLGRRDNPADRLLADWCDGLLAQLRKKQTVSTVAA